MNKVTEPLRKAFVLLLGVGLALVAIPIVVAICVSALALLMIMQRGRRQSYHGDGVYDSTRKGATAQSHVHPTIETTYTVVRPSS